MDKNAYVEQLEKEIVELKKCIEELERLLGINSKNLSKPPSSDPPGFSAVSPKRRPKKPGAKKRHQPHLRQLFPPEKVMHRIKLKPEVCFCSGTHFEECDEEPLRHQIVDIPPIVPEVTEYIPHVCRCKDCGELVYAPLPHEVRRRHFGPGVLALVAVFVIEAHIYGIQVARFQLQFCSMYGYND